MTKKTKRPELKGYTEVLSFHNGNFVVDMWVDIGSSGQYQLYVNSATTRGQIVRQIARMASNAVAEEKTPDGCMLALADVIEFGKIAIAKGAERGADWMDRDGIIRDALLAMGSMSK